MDPYKKWPLKVILHFFDLSNVNSWFEYKLACQQQKVKKKDQLGLMAFRMSIAGFLNAGTTRKRSLEHVENDDKPPLRLLKKIRVPLRVRLSPFSAAAVSSALTILCLSRTPVNVCLLYSLDC
ncbi:hypothetical protein J6590_045615 [Homalodisca vitripennis]|nr:hypothetical protein J6590_045615 [Homalodisca vitripennis]